MKRGRRYSLILQFAPIIEISSGRPFNIITNTDTNNDQSSQTDRPNVLPDGTLVLRRHSRSEILDEIAVLRILLHRLICV